MYDVRFREWVRSEIQCTKKRSNISSKLTVFISEFSGFRSLARILPDKKTCWGTCWLPLCLEGRVAEHSLCLSTSLPSKMLLTGLSNEDFVDFPAATIHEVLDEAVVEAGQEVGDEVVVGRVQLPQGESRCRIMQCTYFLLCTLYSCAGEKEQNDKAKAKKTQKRIRI